MRGLITILLFSVSFSGYSFPDTIYFNSNWKISDNSLYTYYRVLDVQDDKLVVYDHYKSGVVQMYGVLEFTEDNAELAKTSQDMKGLETGKYSWYNENGTIYYSIDYDPALDELSEDLLSTIDPSTLKLETSYFMNGNKREEGLTTSSGTPHGKTTEYHKNGHKSTETTYNQGVVVETRYTYRDDGIMIASTEYEDGLKHGEQKRYDDLGRLKETRVYEKDKLVDRKRKYISFNRTR